MSLTACCGIPGDGDSGFWRGLIEVGDALADDGSVRLRCIETEFEPIEDVGALVGEDDVLP